ncbi:hypothetical protein F5888DRAFT_1639265 [Russula emetica]|nr:hypothetical protein F5888DRAFT_1639265 [Russula emetica]
MVAVSPRLFPVANFGRPKSYLPTRRKRRREERSFAVPESIIVGDRGKGVFEDLVLPHPSIQKGTFLHWIVKSLRPRQRLAALNARVCYSIRSSSPIRNTPPVGSQQLPWKSMRGVWFLRVNLSNKAASSARIAARLYLRRAHIITQQNDDAKIILANAAQHVGQSVKIWLVAADLKHDGKVKKRVLRRALEHIPNLVRLWKETINLETSPADARILLSGAVEVIPLSIELWLALARLETPEKAIGVLNKARKAVPTSQNIGLPQGICGRTLVLEATEELERVDKTLATAVRTSRAHGILLTREKWLTEAERCEAEEAADALVLRARCSHSLYAYSPTAPTFGAAWLTWRRHTALTRTSTNLLARAVECCPQAEVQWLMWAKGKWLGGDVHAAREVLERAFLEAENGELAGTGTVARTAYVAGIKAVQKNVTLRVLASRLEEADGKSIRARALLEKARLVNPKSDVLWAGQGAFRRARSGEGVACALQECPTSDMLWSMAIWSPGCIGQTGGSRRHGSGSSAL